jgi:hypothetical protein
MAAGYPRLRRGLPGVRQSLPPKSLRRRFRLGWKTGARLCPRSQIAHGRNVLPPGVEWVQVVERLPGTWDGPSLDCPCRVLPWSRLINVPGRLMSGLP